MANAVYRLYPANRYLEASLCDKLMAGAVDYLPTYITDRLRLGFQAQLINLYR